MTQVFEGITDLFLWTVRMWVLAVIGVGRQLMAIAKCKQGLIHPPRIDIPVIVSPILLM